MLLPVVGFDPSLNHWGIAEGKLDLTTGYLSNLVLDTIEPEKKQGKQVRQNSVDIQRAEDLAAIVIPVAQRNKVVFVECPVGSQSAAAMKAYGIVVGVLGAIRALGIPVIEVTALESKKIFTGDKNASKDRMIATAVGLYPEANFPIYRDEIAKKAEHVADAIAAIHAGVQTPVFKNLMRLFAEVK